ncbi:MAG: inorganic phosphate transporter [Bacteroidetes bacterium]|nr:inorganic phosphate transporter [Bacteroidota bacterium]
MFGLDAGLTILLLLCLFAACAFEFINGFHDTANAVATVIYTHSLKPRIAVMWSGFWNFIGVYFGGIAVAMGIVNLLPVEALVDANMSHGIAMIMSLIFTAIIWNLGTWYLGIPVSSSHTLIGSIFGVGLAFMFLPGSSSVALNWHKVQEVGLSLLISPFLGFFLAILLMYLMRIVIKNKQIFKKPPASKAPPFWIRFIMIFTCTAVSFSHGSNDGQKGVGLVMMILIGIVPGYFALDAKKAPKDMNSKLVQIETTISNLNTNNLKSSEKEYLLIINSKIDSLLLLSKNANTFKDIPENKHFEIRKDIILISKTTDKFISSVSESGYKIIPAEQIADLKKNISSLKTNTEFAPWWVILMISLSLGVGTMVGWKRIVITIGEKIGKTQLNYAQGAASQFIAASTISASSLLGLPVSTTHVLSSGIAGCMVAENGIKNLQAKTMKNIGLAWIVTLPVTIVLSGLIFLILRWILG